MKRFFCLVLLEACCPKPIQAPPPVITTVVKTVREPCAKAQGAPPEPNPFVLPVKCLPGKVCWDAVELSVFLTNYENLKDWSEAVWATCKGE